MLNVVVQAAKAFFLNVKLHAQVRVCEEHGSSMIFFIMLRRKMSFATATDVVLFSIPSMTDGFFIMRN